MPGLSRTLLLGAALAATTACWTRSPRSNIKAVKGARAAICALMFDGLEYPPSPVAPA
jgi:hypothetical protein